MSTPRQATSVAEPLSPPAPHPPRAGPGAAPAGAAAPPRPPRTVQPLGSAA